MQQMNGDGFARKTLVLRLAVAFILFLICSFAGFSDVLQIVICIFACICAGLNLFLESWEELQEKIFFSQTQLLIFVGLICFVLGYRTEVLFMLICATAAKIGETYIKSKVQTAAFDLCRNPIIDGKSYRNPGENKDACRTEIGEKLNATVQPISFVGVILAVLVIILLPLLAHYNIRVAFHRGLILLLILTPASCLKSLQTIAQYALGACASEGFLFKNAKGIEKISKVETAIFERDAIICEDVQHVRSMKSSVTDKNTFLNFVIHLVCNSNQNFAKVIMNDVKIPYDPSLIQNFQEIPGYGVSGMINQYSVMFGNRELFDREGLILPERASEDGIEYYLFLAKRYVGTVTLSASPAFDYSQILTEFHSSGIKKCFLLGEEGDSFPEFDQIYETTENTALNYTEDICSMNRGTKLLISAKTKSHSKAAVDCSIHSENKFADVYTEQKALGNLPYIRTIGLKMKQIAFLNTFVVITVKALMVFLTILGYCNLWTFILLDEASVIFTLWNSQNVTSNTVSMKIPAEPEHHIKIDVMKWKDSLLHANEDQ